MSFLVIEFSYFIAYNTLRIQTMKIKLQKGRLQEHNGLGIENHKRKIYPSCLDSCRYPTSSLEVAGHKVPGHKDQCIPRHKVHAPSPAVDIHTKQAISGLHKLLNPSYPRLPSDT